MKNIAAALVAAQKQFEAVRKTSDNPYFKSKYADLDTCMSAVTDALNANGVFLTQQTKACDDGVIVCTVFIHESGEMYDSGELHVPAAKNDPQGYGSALTYARRYSLMTACGLAPEDDDGNTATDAVRKKSPVTAEQIIAKLEKVTSRPQFEAFYKSTIGPFLKDPANEKFHGAVSANAAAVGKKFPKED